MRREGLWKVESFVMRPKGCEGGSHANMFQCIGSSLCTGRVTGVQGTGKGQAFRKRGGWVGIWQWCGGVNLR